jgi:hypothetical protein
MAEKLFDKLLTFVAIISLLGFLGFSAYILISHVGLTQRRLAVDWSLIYVFTVTLWFKGSLADHKGRMRRFVVEWVVTCLVGLLVGAVVLILG